MNVFIRIAVAVFSLVVLTANAANEEAVAKATEAATSWLALTDAGDGAGSWKVAASLFQAGVPQAKWEQSLAAARGPLGALKGRKVSSAKYSKTLPGAPDGEYVVIQYSSQFANKASAVETVTPTREKDGSWKVSGYYIK
jgi:Protein of unknown function (DUF4019)